MERKNNPIFVKVIQACEEKGLKILMGFKQHWNKELIAQFYAMVYFGYFMNERGQSERAMFWMTEGEQFQLSFSNFLTLFRLPHD
jgi:nucleoside diphosphate kinase